MIGLNVNTRSLLSGATPPPPPWWQTLYPQSTLAADFANNRAMLLGAATPFTDFLSITRTSPGYAENTDGSLTDFNNNELRISNQGVLIESARTNVIKDSENLTTSDWSLLGSATVNPTAHTAPDLAKTSDEIQNLTTTGDGVEYTDPLTINIASKTFQFSVYLRTSIPSDLELTVGATTGSPASSTSTASADNTWRRFTVSHTYAADNADFFVRITRPSSGTASSVHAWGAQLEQGSFSTSLIPTQGSPATRATDNIHFSNLTWLDPTKGTLLLQVQSDQPAISNRRLLGFASAQGLETAPNQTTIENWNGSTLMQANPGNARNWNTGMAAAFGWDNQGRSLCVDGGSVSSDQEGPGTMTMITLGSRDGTSSFWEGYFKTLIYYNHRKTNVQMQTDTA